MSSLSIAGIIIGILGVVFGVTMKVKNKRISDLEQQTREAKTESLYRKYQEEIAKKDAGVSKAAIKLAKKVVSEPREIEKPDGNEGSTMLTEDEQDIAASLSSDPFAE